MIENAIKAILRFLQQFWIIETHFDTIPIPAQTTVQALPIGQGGCIAVRLRLNKYVLGDTAATEIPANQRQIYYGDSNHQEFELLYGEQSHTIYARDLSEVFIKGNGTANSVQVISYHLKVW